jgi:3-oxoacyl-[acyl-carrier-protein] synthase II
VTTQIAVTGIGLVTALGSTREENWRRLLAGDCGIGPATVFEVDGYRSRIAAEVAMDAIDAPLTPLERRRLSRGDRMGVHAATEALVDSGLLDTVHDRTRVGVFLGAGTADLLRNEDYYRTWITKGLERARPSDAWNHFLSTPVDAIAARFGLEGPRGCVVAACSSSTIAIGRGVEAIRSGRADAVLAGGTDAISRVTFSGFNVLRLMDPMPCRPFDRSRGGMNIGEGAAILLLERMDQARARGASIYAELAGHSLGCEAFHPTAPEPEGRPVAAVVSLALKNARINADEVDHVNAHGTATPQNDLAEGRGLRRVFGDDLRRIPVTSIKAMVGHCLGAAGGVEAAVAALSVARGAIPPTIHHGETDVECGVEVVANQARQQRVRVAMSTSLGFGGNDSAVVFRALDHASGAA